MENKRKTRFWLLLLVLFVCNNLIANDVVFVAGTDVSSTTSITKDGITISLTNGTLSRDDNYRPYAGSTTTISSTVGNITKVVFTCTASGSSYYSPNGFNKNSVSSGTYSYSGRDGIWTGDAASFSIAANAQVRITQIVVTYTPSGTTQPDITYNGEDSYELVIGSEFTEPTFSISTEGVSLSYESDNTGVASVDQVTGEVTINGVGTTTITASFAGNTSYSSWTKSYTITVKAEPQTGDAYTLVTSVNDLADGDNVIIVNSEASKAMSTTQNTNNRGATEVIIDNNSITVPSETDIQVFTLEGNSSGWYFNTGSGYIYAASSNSNYLRTEPEKDDNAKATISISDGDATITFQGTNTRNLLKYNSGNGIFACYASGQSPVQIYRKPVSKTLTGIMLSGEYPTTFFMGDEFSFGETGTVTAVYNDNSTKVVTELATFSGYDMSTAGGQTVTVSYTERGVTKEQTYEITVNNRALSSITLSGDYPTTFNVGDEFSHEGMTVTASYDNNTSEDVTADAIFEGYDMSTTGTQTVTVSYTKGDVTKTATYDITVSEVAVTGITLDQEATILVGNTKTLTATIAPSNATDNSVTWSSDNESVAIVADGVVTAVAEGTANITATANGGENISATCAVTVVGELDETTATGNLNNSDTGVFAGVDGFTNGTHSASGTLTTDVGNVTVDYAGTTNSYLNDKHIRTYSNGTTLKFTAPEGYELRGIDITFSSGSPDYLETNPNDTYTSNTENKLGSWSGRAKAVTFIGKEGTSYLTTAEVTLIKAPLSPKLDRIDVEGYTTDFVVGDTYTFDGTATVTYEDGSTKEVTSEVEVHGPDMSTPGEKSANISYEENGLSVTAVISITVREAQTITFRKISSTDELVAGKRYVIVSDNHNVAMGACSDPSSTTSYFNKYEATFSDESVALTEGKANANFLTLGGEDGAWTFATSIETNKYLAYTGGGNYLESGASAETASAQWTITFDEQGNAAIQNKNKTDRFIMYNKQQPRFACYTGTQQPVQLYVESDLEDVTLTISAAGYATLYYSDRALKVPEGVTAKTYKVVSGKLTESKTYEAGSKIPKGEAVVLKGAASDYTFKVTSTPEPKDADNQLKGSDEEEETTGGTYYYALQAKAADGSGGPGMYWMKEGGAAFKNGAHKAYMALDEQFAEVQGMAKSFYLFEDATGIGSAQADGEAAKMKRFNMSGQRVGSNYKGIVIVNGKKILRK